MGDLALRTRSGEGIACVASERPTTEICLWIVRRLPNKTAPPVAYRAGPFWGASTPKVFVGKDLRQHDRSRGSGANGLLIASCKFHRPVWADVYFLPS